MSQTTMTQYQDVAYAGMLDGIGPTKSVRSYAAEEAIPFAYPVKLGTTKDKEVLKTTSGALTIGFAMASHVEQTNGGTAQYAQYDAVPVITSGRFWIETSDAVVAGAVANLTVATGKLTDEAVAAGIEAFTQFSARFITGTSGAGLAIVEIK